MALLRKLAKERNSAVIVVTHDRRMVEGFDRLYDLQDGRILNRQEESAEPGIAHTVSA